MLRAHAMHDDASRACDAWGRFARGMLRAHAMHGDASRACDDLGRFARYDSKNLVFVLRFFHLINYCEKLIFG